MELPKAQTDSFMNGNYSNAPSVVKEKNATARRNKKETINLKAE
jgi:hypothetical protein